MIEELPLLDPKSVSSCSKDLAKGPWEWSGNKAGYGPGASSTDPLPPFYPSQESIPSKYREAEPALLEAWITEARTKLDEKVVILGHYYQREEVIRHSDYLGDSYLLSVAATRHPRADYIVFCGVHFMAETADILSQPHQQVILPNIEAGCSMADMADPESIDRCWKHLMSVFGPQEGDDNVTPIIPVTYMNSSAELKAFCGQRGGIVCTSSNADKVLTWAFERGKRVLFFPDQHLGRNTGLKMGFDLDELPLWNRRKASGGLSDAQLLNSKIILWDGFCSVHKRFRVDQIELARKNNPQVRVIVHPECPMEVVQAADESGSTEFILNTIRNAPVPTAFAVGTEISMVRHLALKFPQHEITCLDPVVCPCSTMYRIHPSYLAWVLEELAEGRTVNQITVPSDIIQDASIALNRMLEATQN